MKSIFKLFKAVFFTLVLALVFHNFTARFLLSAYLRWTLGTAVDIESAKVDFMNTQILFEGIIIKNPKGFPHGILAEIPEIFVDIESSSLWERRVHLDEVAVKIADIRVLRIPGNRLNLLELKVFRPEAIQSEKEDEREHVYKPSRFKMERFTLSLEKGTYTDLSSGMPVQKSFELGIKQAVFENLKNPGDIIETIAWETLKRMGLEGVLGDAIKTLGLEGSAASSLKNEAQQAAATIIGR